MGEPVRAVLFDLGNTLVSYYRAPEYAPILRESVDSLCEFLADQKTVVVERDRAFERALALNTEDPSFRVRPLATRLVEIFGEHDLADSDLREMCDIFLRPIFRLGTLDPHALSTLEAIRGRGIRTAIVSNTPWGSPSESWTEELHRHGLVEAVDAAVFCVDVGLRKPAPQIFQHTLSLLGVDPVNSIFVGDDPRQDAAGAQRSGLRAILIDPRGAEGEAPCPVVHGLTELLPLIDAISAG